MRRATFIFSLTLFVGTFGLAAACSDQQPASPTAPAAGAAGITTSQDVSTSQVSGGGKPTPAPVGFTQVIEVQGNWSIVEPYGMGNSEAICPVGTTVVGGGYNFGGYKTTNPPWIKNSRRTVTNGWAVSVINNVVDAGPAGYAAYAYCAS